jgi:hypothetical protein
MIGHGDKRRRQAPSGAVASALMAGSLVGVARVAGTTSIAVLVFAGPLAESLPAAIGLTLVSEVVALTVVSSLGRFAGLSPAFIPLPRRRQRSSPRPSRAPWPPVASSGFSPSS